MQETIDNDLVLFAHDLADAAGEILRRSFRMPLGAERKKDASPVTIADRAVEMKLREMIEARYPAHGIVGEEFGTVREDAEYQWVLDPIDGTRSFIAGYPLFTTLIGVAYNNVPVLGIIEQSVLRERWLGVSGKSTLYTRHDSESGKLTLNIELALLHKHKKRLSDAVIATTSIDYFTDIENQLYQQVKKQCASNILGGDAYAYAMLTGGHIGLVIDAGLKPYDFCTLRPVIEGAGGIITDWAGKAIILQTNGRIIAGANADLHHEAIKILQSEV